jgi:hypothetical protein
LKEVPLTAPNATHRSLASLKLPKPVPAIIAHAQAIVTSMTDNPHFPSPVPALWVVSKAVTDLQNAEAAVLTRAKGKAAIRNAKQTMVGSLLQQLRGYVQVTADGDPDNAAAIIESAGMTLKKQPTLRPRVFSAKPGSVSGEIKVVCPTAGHRASYDWEYSIDSGVNWLAMPSSLQASTKLEGLTPGTSVMFKYRSVTSKGVGDWSAAITVTVK